MTNGFCVGWMQQHHVLKCPVFFQVVANADASDLRDDYQQAQTDKNFTSNGLSITMRIFATAQECCDALAAENWMVCIASASPRLSQDATAADKKAIVVAVPFPSQPFVAAHQGATAEQTGKFEVNANHLQHHLYPLPLLVSTLFEVNANHLQHHLYPLPSLVSSLVRRQFTHYLTAANSYKSLFACPVLIAACPPLS